MSKWLVLLIFVTLCCLCSAHTGPANYRKKRQLFREHLLPHQGGKIPDSAFVPERISLNRLNQNGFYTLDGVVLEQKSPDVHHTAKKYPPPTIKLKLAPDNRHVAPPGRQYTPRVVDTTYIIREPTRYRLSPHQILYFHQLPLPPKVRYIQRRPNELYNAAQIFKEFQPYLKSLHAYD